LYPKKIFCNNKECNHRVNIKKETLENEFDIFLENMKLPIGLFNLIENIFEKSWEQSKGSKKSKNKRRTRE